MKSLKRYRDAHRQTSARGIGLNARLKRISVAQRQGTFRESEFAALPVLSVSNPQVQTGPNAGQFIFIPDLSIPDGGDIIQ